MIDRPLYLNQLSRAVRRSPITALVGPRQCGKTTLARMFAKERTTTFLDLESQLDLNRLQNPQLMLGSLRGLVILDEIQVMPELFSVLRVLVDRPGNKTRFLILGSASPDLVKNVSETLAGRVEFVELSGFGLHETGTDSSNVVWLRGGFPRSFLAVATQTVSPGARASFKPSWPATSPNSVSRFRLQPCVVSGRCWPIITVRPGMLRSSAGHSTCRIKRYAPILTFSPELLWSGSFNHGTKTSESAKLKHPRYTCGIPASFTLCSAFPIFRHCTAIPGQGHRGKALPSNRVCK